MAKAALGFELTLYVDAKLTLKSGKRRFVFLKTIESKIRKLAAREGLSRVLYPRYARGARNVAYTITTCAGLQVIDIDQPQKENAAVSARLIIIVGEGEDSCVQKDETDSWFAAQQTGPGSPDRGGAMAKPTRGPSNSVRITLYVPTKWVLKRGQRRFVFLKTVESKIRRLAEREGVLRALYQRYTRDVSRNVYNIVTCYGRGPAPLWGGRGVFRAKTIKARKSIIRKSSSPT